MVDALTTALATGLAVVSVTIDGVTTQFNRQQALQELAFWERRAARAAGRRPIASSINLRHAF
jgi:hypothetical protein